MNDALPPDDAPDSTSEDTTPEATAADAGTDAPATPPASQPPPEPPPPAPPPRPHGELAPRPPGGGKPGKVTAIAVVNLAQGVLSTCYALWLVIFFLGLGAATFGIGCLALPFGLYPLAVGILAIVYATKLLPEAPKPVLPWRWLAVMQICTVLLGDVIALAAGIVNLVLFSDPEVVAWFERNKPDPLA